MAHLSASAAQIDISPTDSQFMTKHYACESARPARLGLAVADGKRVGTNRRDPNGPSDMEMPVLWVREADGEAQSTLRMPNGDDKDSVLWTVN